MAPRGLELEETGDKSKNNPISAAPTAQEDGGESAVEENGTEIVLNASRLQVESEKWSKKNLFWNSCDSITLLQLGFIF